MHAELCAAGVSIGRHRTARLMRDNHLKANQKRRFKKTTDSDHGGPVAANLLIVRAMASRTASAP